MMKHLFSFLIIVSLLLFGCRSKTQSNFQPELSEQAEESYSLPEEYAEEVIVTGKVLNRDFYPNEKDLTLIIPFFRKMENQYCARTKKALHRENASLISAFYLYGKRCSNVPS